MKENWFAISIFSVIFGILGYLLGCCSGCCSSYGYGGNSCSPEAGCVYSGHGVHGAHGEDGVFFFDHHGDSDGIHAIIHELETQEFTGDTTITIDGGTIQVTKSDEGEIEVKVEMEEMGDWHGGVEKTIIITKGDDGEVVEILMETEEQ